MAKKKLTLDDHAARAKAAYSKMGIRADFSDPQAMRDLFDNMAWAKVVYHEAQAALQRESYPGLAKPGRPRRGTNNAEALRAAMKAKGWNVEKLADVSKIHPRTIRYALAGRKMDPVTWLAFWRALAP